MMSNMIEVEQLVKSYKIRNKSDESRFSLLSKYTEKKAVDGISFQVKKGEILGFIGPNGAGKSTTVKMLSGILVPASGKILVNGIVPYKNRKKNGQSIGVVFGQRSQLWWNLPVMDSFEIVKAIYKVSDKNFKDNLERFHDILNVGEYLDIPVRKLSLGQRMRVEIAASLMHNPEIVFLDEPTIGLDMVAKEKINEFIKLINQERKVTIILTTHDMRDIEKLCDRILVIDHGKTIYDGDIETVKSKYGKNRMLIVDIEDELKSFHINYGNVIKEEGSKKYIMFNKEDFSAIDMVNEIENEYAIKDFSLVETDIEDIVKCIYSEQNK